MISYDAVTDQIVAFGQNKEGQCFVGKGFFDVKNKWVPRFFIGGPPKFKSNQ
jgi:hypothetical protein